MPIIDETARETFQQNDNNIVQENEILPFTLKNVLTWNNQNFVWSYSMTITHFHLLFPLHCSMSHQIKCPPVLPAGRAHARTGSNDCGAKNWCDVTENKNSMPLWQKRTETELPAIRSRFVIILVIALPTELQRQDVLRGWFLSQFRTNIYTCCISLWRDI